MTDSKLASALRQAQAEIAQHEAVEEQLYILVDTLEKALGDRQNEMAAYNQKLRLENHTRVQDQREIRALRENLVRREEAYANLSKELEALTYGISHDLRAPLRHLVGFSGALLEDYAGNLDDTARGYLDCMVRAGEKMEGYIEALVKLSRVTNQRVAIKTVDLGKLVRDYAEVLIRQSPDRQAMLNIQEGISVNADQELMTSAINNLVDNAWKFTSHEETATIEFGCKRQGGETVYYLRDNGVGFDMRYAERLFGPFQRMHGGSEWQGGGVGLALAQRVIHRHGGRIWAEAEPGDGATFFFTLADPNVPEGATY
ncbi:sensor histidine kinase [Geomonas sp. Red276]